MGYLIVSIPDLCTLSYYVSALPNASETIYCGLITAESKSKMCGYLWSWVGLQCVIVAFPGHTHFLSLNFYLWVSASCKYAMFYWTKWIQKILRKSDTCRDQILEF